MAVGSEGIALDKSTGWTPVVEGRLQELAISIVSELAHRVQEPVHTERLANSISGRSDLPNKRLWAAFDITRGHTALALFFGHYDRCFPGEGWDEIAHTYLTHAVRSLEDSSLSVLPVGLLGGLAGMCFTTNYLSRGGIRYRNLLTKLDDLLTAETIAFSHVLAQHETALHVSDYDLISGPTGIGAYLLLRGSADNIMQAVDAVTSQLLHFSKYREANLRIHILPNELLEEQERKRYPLGSTDCGIAHGVPGVLSFFSLASMQGINRPELGEAIRRLAAWLIAHQGKDTWGIAWPYIISPVRPLSPGGTSLSSMNEINSRASWCYGSPGIARALWLAGHALDEPDIQTVALDAMCAVNRRPITTRELPSPILCHGIAGLLQTVLRFANDTGDSYFADMARSLTQQTIDLFEPDSIAGFRDFEVDGQKVDDLGFLTGAVGVALALLAAATDIEPSWDRLLLLS